MQIRQEEIAKPKPIFSVATLVVLVALFATRIWSNFPETDNIGQQAAKQTVEQNDIDKMQIGEVFRDSLKDGSLGPEMVVIPAGRFRMGDMNVTVTSFQGGGDDDEKPVHDVSVARFAMGKYEVTFAEYDRFIEATSGFWASLFGIGKQDDEGWGRGNRPVINVSWHDAVAYVKWLSEQTGKQYRLPTEAEWEYAARAGTETKYWWGNGIGSNRANCSYSSCKDRFKYTAPVDSFAPNPFKLYHILGNIWEWSCSEYESKYSGQEQHCAKNVNENLKRIIDEQYQSNQAAFARAIEVKPTQMSNMHNGKAPIGNSMAQRIENLVGWERGALDLPPEKIFTAYIYIEIPIPLAGSLLETLHEFCKKNKQRKP